MQHVLTNCVFARQFRYNLLAPLGLECTVPRRNEKSFTDWWRQANKKVVNTQRKGFNSMVILGAWTLWLQRNRGFDVVIPSLARAHHSFKEEVSPWCFAGARKLQDLFFIFLGRGRGEMLECLERPVPCDLLLSHR